MLRKKLTRLVSGTIVMSMIFSTMAQAKPNVPAGASAIMGDTYLPTYGPGSVFNLTQQMVDRGFSGTDLDLIYSQQQGPNRNYYNLNDYYDTNPDHKIGDNKTTPEIWDNVKYKFDDSANGGRGAIVPIDDESNIATTTIQVRKGFTSFIKLENNVLKLSNEVAFGDLKNMIEATDKSNQVYSAKLGNEEISDATTLVAGNTYNLTVTAEDGKTVDSSTYTIEVSQSGGGIDLPAPAFTKNLTIKGEATTGNPVKECNVGDPDITLEVKAELEENKEAEISYEWYSIGEKQDIPSQDLLQYYDLPEANLVGTGESFTFTPSKVGTTYYFATAIYKEGDSTSRTQSNLATIVVKEANVPEGDVSVDKYVYNVDSKDKDTMGKLTGKAPLGAEITIEANYKELAKFTVDKEDNGKDDNWVAVFPRQNAGTMIQVTVTIPGKKPVIIPVTVEGVTTEQIDEFKERIDLKKLIEIKNNLHVSPDGAGLTDGYYIESQTEADAFKTYIELIEDTLTFKYQLSTVDLEYVNHLSEPVLEIYSKSIKPVGEKENTVDLRINITAGKGTLTATYEDGTSISAQDNVYKVKKGSKVKFDATTKEGNVIKFTWNEGQPDSSGDKSTLTVTKQINADTTLDVLFTSKENMETAEKVEEAIKEAIEVIDPETKLMTIKTTEVVTDAEAAKPIVQSYVKDLLTAKGVDESKVSIEVTKEESLQRLVSFKYTIIIKDIKTGDVLYRITLTVEFVNNEADFTVTTEAQNGEITAKYDDGENIHIKSDGTFFVDANEKRKVVFTATADEGYKFKNWVVDNANAGEANPLERTITDVTTVKAVFEKDKEQPPVKDTYDITVATNGNGIVKVTGYEDVTENTYKVNKGASVTFEAIPNADSEFVNWTVGTETKTANPLDITDVNADVEVTANFKLKNPDKEPSQKPTITADSYTLVEDTNSDGDIFAQISGTAGANANITFEDAAGNKISTLKAVTADNKGAWTAIIQRQSGGTKVIAVAEETDKEKTKSDSYEVKAATSEDMKKITDVQNKINDIIGEGSKVEVSEDGAGLPKGTLYITKLEEEALKVMEELLNKLGVDSLSGADITYLEGYINEALNVVVKTATGENLKEFADLKIENITNATVGEAVYTKVTGVPTDAANFDLTTTNTKVEIAYNAEKAELEVIAKEVMTEATTIDVKATADGYKDKTVNFTITSKEAEAGDKEFTSLAITNITNATVGEAVYTKVTGVPTDAANFDLTTTNTKVEIAYNAEKEQLEVIAKEVMTEATTIDVKATADGYKDKTVNFTITAKESGGETPDEKEFEGLGVRNITGATVNEAVYMDVYGIPEGVANFNIVSKNNELITVEYNKTKSQWEVTPKVAMDDAPVEVTASADGYKDKDLAFKITTIKEDTKNAIKIVSVKTGENTFTDIPQDGSVEAIVYNNAVNGTVYQIYARLSGSKAEFKIENEAVSFALDLVAYSDAETFSQADAINLLNGLELDTSKKVLMKEIKRTEGGTGTLNITLSSDVIKSIDGENPTEVSITFKYKQGSEVSSDNAILSPLVLKAIKSHME